MTWYCVKEIRDDDGNVTVRIVDTTESDEKPMDFADSTEEYDISYTWLSSMDEAERLMRLLKGEK